MPRVLDLDRWTRRAHFDFFRGYERPFWSLTAEVDVTEVWRRTRAPEGPSFFLASLWCSLAAVHEVEPMRYRVRRHGDREEVVVHELVHAGATVLRPDETFAFATFEHAERFSRFAASGREVLERVRSGPPGLEPQPGRDDLVYYSVIPWVSFTSFTHARDRPQGDSVPRIVFGRHREDRAGRRVMPVAVDVHHALVDGLDVGRFFAAFERHLERPALE